MSQSLVGSLINNRYRVDAFVASGGMGEVYRVFDLQRSAYLAMKVLRADPTEDITVFRLFQREADALKTLAHPNIVPFYGLEQTIQFSFILEGFIDGPTLKETLAQRGMLPVTEALTYLKSLSAALGFAHNQGFIHCDVKPGNVMTDKGGNVYLTDFGIVRHTSPGTTVTLTGAGTPAYMAPEQAMGRPLSAAADVYALAIVFYEMLTGHRPFTGNEPETQAAGSSLSDRIRYAQIQLPPPDPRLLNAQLPYELCRVLWVALSKQPEQRFGSTFDFFIAACHAAGLREDQIPTRLNPAGQQPGTEPVRLNDNSIPQWMTPSMPSAHDIPLQPQPAPSRKLWIIGGITGLLLCLSAASLILLPQILPLLFPDGFPAQVGDTGARAPSRTPRSSEKVLPTEDLRPIETIPVSPTEVPLPEITRTFTSIPPTATFPPAPTDTPPPPAERVLIPDGTFLMGATDRDSAVETNDTILGAETPSHTVYLDAFYIDLTEVTNAMFADFVRATGYRTHAEISGEAHVYRADTDNFRPQSGATWQDPDGSGRGISGLDDHPVVQISWSDAAAFCSWRGGRLPTEAEWEKAARGDDGRLYPWGNSYNGNLLNGSDKTLGQDPELFSYNDGYAFTAPVGSYAGGASPYGVLDMAGNVLEWVNDYSSRSYYNVSPDRNPPGPSSGPAHVLRGGSWYSGPRNNRAAHRVGAEELEIAVQNYGFRCAYDR